MSVILIAGPNAMPLPGSVTFVSTIRATSGVESATFTYRLAPANNIWFKVGAALCKDLAWPEPGVSAGGRVVNHRVELVRGAGAPVSTCYVYLNVRGASGSSQNSACTVTVR